MMTNGDPEEQIFYPTLTQIIDLFSCSPLFLFIYLFIKLFNHFEINFQKSLNYNSYAKMQFPMMTLLDVLGKIA